MCALQQVYFIFRLAAMKVRDVSKKDFMSVSLCRTWYRYTAFSS